MTLLKHQPAFTRPPLITGGGLPDPVIPDPTVPDIRKPDRPEHYHQDEYGMLVKCYHKCRSSALSPGFWIGLTVGFFPEHLLWEKVPPFSLLTKLVGL